MFGNIYLYNLDLELNKNPDIVFLRYIDDIIIIGKNYNDVLNIYRKQLLPNLERLGLSVYGEKDEKFKKGIFKSNAGIDYLGVNISNNVVKPSIGQTLKGTSKRQRRHIKNARIVQIIIEDVLFEC